MAGIPAQSHTFFRLGPAAPGQAQCFAVRRGELSTRTDARHHSLRERIDSRYPITSLGALVSREPDYGTSARAVERTSKEQPRYIRITDFGDDGIDANHQFVAAEFPDSDSELAIGDLLFARSGSVGKTYLHEDASEPAIFAGYCIRFRLDESQALPRFVYWWTKTAAYERWVAAIQRPSVQANINKEEFKACAIPLPPVAEQVRLVAAMDAARSERRNKLAEAEGLLAGVDGYLREALGLAAAPAAGRRVFAVRGQSAFERIDPHFHAPEFERIQQILAETACQPLGEIAAFSDAVWNPKDYPHPAFRYIEISTVNPKTGEALWNEVAIAEAPSRARKPVQSGDIIVSLTRPHHGSIAYLGPEFDGCIASTGFAVIRNVAPTVNRAYLWAILRAQFSLAQMRQRSSGGNYPAITEPELQKITIPVPDMETQTRIAAEVQRRHELASQLRTEAESGWQAAREWFEGELLG